MGDDRRRLSPERSALLLAFEAGARWQREAGIPGVAEPGELEGRAEMAAFIYAENRDGERDSDLAIVAGVEGAHVATAAGQRAALAEYEQLQDAGEIDGLAERPELGSVVVVSVAIEPVYGGADLVVRDSAGVEHEINCGRHWPTAAGWPSVGAVLPLTWAINWRGWEASLAPDDPGLGAELGDLPPTGG
jgi:hypothetical protein